MSRTSILSAGARVMGITAMIGLATISVPAIGQDGGAGGNPIVDLGPGGQFYAHDYAALAGADPVDRQLAEYARQVPEIGFLRVYGAAAASVIRRLPALLGEGASNVDYEHEAQLRETLVELQLERIALMVRNDLPSATLFRVGANSHFDHDYLCVISLDTAPYRHDPAFATRLMSSDSPNGPLFGDDARLIGNDDFLRFTVDHEVFHCLDAYFNGPTILKTRDSLQGLYQSYVNEARADAFASRSFKNGAASSEQFLDTVAALRTTSLLDMDMQHFTGDVIRRSVDATPTYTALDLREQVAASHALVHEAAPTWEQFARRLAGAARLIEHLGGDPSPLLLTLEGQTLPHPSDAQTASLLDAIEQAQGVLTAAAARNGHPAQDITASSEIALRDAGSTAVARDSR